MSQVKDLVYKKLFLKKLYHFQNETCAISKDFTCVTFYAYFHETRKKNINESIPTSDNVRSKKL